MKRILTSTLYISLLLSCSSSPSTIKPNETPTSQVAKIDSLEKVVLQHVYNKIKKLPNVSLKDNKLFIGDNSIQLKIDVEFDGKEKGKWLYAANIVTFYKNGQETQIDVGSVGIGSSREEAINVCIQEWFGVFGIAFTNMLNGDNSIAVSNMKVFPGLMGIRGKLPENTWPKGNDEIARRIISQIQPQMRSQTGDLIPIDIKLYIGINGVVDGECRVDNHVSIQLLNNLKQLSWPSSKEGYMFKQFYLIKMAAH